jgi:SPX domain protein involved in polyphosphate accumulation
MLRVNGCQHNCLIYLHNEQTGNEDTPLSTVNRHNKEDIWNSIATYITSIYFDSPKTMVMYKDRIARIESAQLFRIRWYGDKPCGDELIFLELKTHHEQWVDNNSVKERVALQARDLTQVLLRNGFKWTEDKAQELLLAAKPKLHGDDLDDAVDLLLRIRRLIIKKNLHPCVRSSYRRVAFQSNANNALRFTLDRDIELSSEADAPLGSWCRDDDALVPSVMMPVTVFEVKLGGVVAPTWITSLLDRYKIQDGHKFSKYLSGASMLHEEHVSCLPYWAEDPLFKGFYRNVCVGSKTIRAEYKPLFQTRPPKKGNDDDYRKDSDKHLLDSGNVSWPDNKNKIRSIFSVSMFRTKKSKKISPNQRVRVEVSMNILNFRLNNSNCIS